MILDKNAAVYRLTPNANNANLEQYQAVQSLAQIKLNIQSASAELTAVTGGVYGTTFKAFVTVSGIKIGDRITTSGVNSQNYIVKGTTEAFYGPIPHAELVLFLGDN